jgi:hypothetical protein
MTPEETAAVTTPTVAALTAGFMLDPATYAAGGELGFNGLDFYFAGRGGPLGEVDADVVSAAFVFFNPHHVRKSWEASADVMSRRDAANAFAACLHRWAERVPDDVDVARLAALAGKVVESASPAGAPVFAGWRTLDEPADAKALACHRMNALRELRMAMHGASILAAGMRPVEALTIKTPFMSQVFGWGDDLPEVEQLQSTWDGAEAATNKALGNALGVLDEAERDEFATLCAAITASVA